MKVERKRVHFIKVKYPLAASNTGEFFSQNAVMAKNADEAIAIMRQAIQDDFPQSIKFVEHIDVLSMGSAELIVAVED